MFLTAEITMAQKTISSAQFLEQHQAYFALGDAIAQKLENDTLKLTYKLFFHAPDNLVIDWNPTHQPERLYASLRFAKRFSICEFWCDAPIYKDEKNPHQQHKGMQKSMEMFVKHFLEKPPTKKSGLEKLFQTQTVQNYLKQADQIAEKGYLCTSGDDYQASFYTEIRIHSSKIILSQVNWWNAKSMDRNNYCMRKLAFYIPLSQTKDVDDPDFRSDFGGIHTFKINDMNLVFEDHSTQNHKTCGEEILKAIKLLAK